MTKYFIIFILPFLCSVVQSQDFIRPLPNEQLIKQLTPELFKNQDAVIILKEQSYQINDRKVFYKGSELEGKTIQYTKVLIAKLFTESAVKRYGNFEFSYREYFGNEIPNGFLAMARVLKENGDILEMPEENVINIVSRRTSTGDPLTRKIIFKVPNLAIGDIIQIEYAFDQKFARAFSGIFFYHDRDMVLYSNLYITLPSRENVEFISIPQQTIGEAIVEQISDEFGSGETYFWSARNLNPIPDENYSYPFEDQSYLTAFVIGKTHAGSKDRSNWENLARYYYEDYIDGENVSNSDIETLGFKNDLEEGMKSFETVDSLYSSIRKSLVLTGFNSIRPISDDIDDVFETGKGDASDLAYIMIKILEEWDIDVKGVWIRDKRVGILEESIPSSMWFDRLALKVTIDNQSKVYDFDMAIPNQYEVPWFLDDINIIVVNEDGFEKEKLIYGTSATDNTFNEIHYVEILNNELIDSVDLFLEGSAAQQLRAEIYNDDKPDVLESLKHELTGTVFSDVTKINGNDFLNEKIIEFHARGKSSANLTKIDNNIVFKLKTHYLNEFFNKIYATVRRSDIVFETPFRIKSQWTIKVPDNYAIEKESLKTKSLSGPNSAKSEFSIKQVDTSIFVNLELQFSSKEQSISDFVKLISFLENTINTSEQNLVFTLIEK